MRKKLNPDNVRTYKHRLGDMNGTRVDLPEDRGFFWIAEDIPAEVGLAWLERVLRKEQVASERPSIDPESVPGK